MNLQYISDSKGQTTGVFLKSKYKDIEGEEIDIPEWHKDLVRQRLDDYKKNPGSALDFDTALDDIEKEL
jgi:hypothetical protein